MSLIDSCQVVELYAVSPGDVLASPVLQRVGIAVDVRLFRCGHLRRENVKTVLLIEGLSDEFAEEVARVLSRGRVD